jgi:hypothetical protein
MMPDEWQNYPEKTWAADWYKLFSASAGDARGGLTWRDRLINALNTTTVHSFYSSTEDVLGAYAGTPTTAVVRNAFNAVTLNKPKG